MRERKGRRKGLREGGPWGPCLPKASERLAFHRLSIVTLGMKLLDYEGRQPTLPRISEDLILSKRSQRGWIRGRIRGRVLPKSEKNPAKNKGTTHSSTIWMLRKASSTFTQHLRRGSQWVQTE